MATALELAQGDERLVAAVRRGRRMLHGKAMVAAAASAMPVPGLDWAVDAAVLSRLIPAVSAEFGLTAEQIGRLEPQQRDQVQKAVNMVGSVLIGKFITRDLVLKAAAAVGMRLTTKQAAKYVPFAGQAISALVGYSAIRFLGEEHLKDCVRVAREAQLVLPEPAPRKRLLLPGRA
ncbi:hypothetical protein [Pseudorhodoferax soli]|uniref:EcsC family protein n=1 Tax=Pseudorhodoferax soli TaxID=545864 RepID=A0A368Y043_9BURK|nr:hypothetical protein [Pseudorhodoferax soli]RCW72658.1 hypothetical protein DES41_103264 [Pseudorhodoferax soli]